MTACKKASQIQPSSKPADTPTRWEEVASLRDPEKQKAAMTVLLEQYGPVIRWRLTEDKYCGGDDLEDAYGDFVEWVLEGNQFNKADQSRGQFRCFLATMLTRFLITRIRYRNAQKRGGGEVQMLGLEEADDSQAGITEINMARFDREWARMLMHRAVLRMDAAKISNLGEDEVLGKAATYGNATFSKQLREALREELRLTCGLGLVDEELRHLSDVFRAIRDDLPEDDK